MRVLITSVGTATSVNLIKYFSKNGAYIVGTDINDIGMTAGSLLVDSFLKVPLAISTDYVEKILDIIEKEKIDVLIPVNDSEVYALSMRKNDIPCKCLIPNPDTIRQLRDKYVCSSIVKELGIPVPEILAKDQPYSKRILRDRLGVGSKGIEVICEGEICPIYDIRDRFLQRFIEGEEYTIDVLADEDGNPVYIVPRKRIEVKSGIATKTLILEDKRMIEHVKTILKRFTLPGFSNVQFIKDADGAEWFIEVNYRFSGCGAATLATSPDYLKRYIDVINGKKDFGEINADTRWNMLVTRYYEELVYPQINYD